MREELQRLFDEGHRTIEVGGGVWDLETLLNGGRSMPTMTQFCNGVTF